LRLDYQQFLGTDTEVIVVSPEDAETFQEYWDSADLPFIGLPDQQHEVASLYGQEVKVLKLGRLPAQMIIDKSGTLYYAHYGRSMSDIPANSEILRNLDEITATSRHSDFP